MEEMPVPETETHPPTGSATGEEIDEEISDQPIEDVEEDLVEEDLWRPVTDDLSLNAA